MLVFTPAHQVHLDPVVPLADDAVLVVEPPDEPRRGEPAGIDREVLLDRPERKAALGDQSLEDRRHCRIFQEPRNAAVMRSRDRWPLSLASRMSVE